MIRDAFGCERCCYMYVIDVLGVLLFSVVDSNVDKVEEEYY